MTAAASVVQAVTALRHDAFDVVVSALPVIALTAHAGETERARALAAGFAAHVAKPVGEGGLPAIVARVVRGKRRPPA